MKTTLAKSDPAMRPMPSLRERRRLETRRELVKVALALFAEHGFEATTIGDIAQAAGVSAATFYRYFPRKEDTIFSDLTQRAIELRKALQERPAGTTILAAVRSFFVLQVKKRQREADPEVIKLRHRILEASSALRGLVFEQSLAFTDTLTEAIAAELKPHARTHPRLIAGAVIGALTSTGWSWDASADVDRRFNELFDFLDETIGPVLESRRSRG